MLLVKPFEVPPYLRESEFYRSLDIEANSTFSIPADHMKASTVVETLEDACELLRTVRFWGLNISLMAVFDYAITQPFSEIEEALREFEDEIPFVKAVLHVSKNKDSLGKMIGAAVECGCIEIVRELDKRATASDYSENTVTHAAAGGSIECLLFAQSKMGEAFQTPYSACHAAVASGRIECLKLLCQQYDDALNYPSTEMFSEEQSLYQALVGSAVEHNHVECLEYLHQRGVPLHQWAAFALLHDKVACLQVHRGASRRLLESEQRRSGALLYRGSEKS